MPASNGLASQDGGEVGRKDDLVVGDDDGLVLRSGLGEEPGHAADCLNDDIGAEKRAFFSERGVLGLEGVGDGQAERTAAGGVSAWAERGRLQGQVGGMLANKAEHGFDEDVGELPRGKVRSLRDEGFPLGFDNETVLMREREDDGGLVGEVVVEAADRSAAASGDSGHGGGIEANFSEETGSDVEDGRKSAL